MTGPEEARDDEPEPELEPLLRVDVHRFGHGDVTMVDEDEHPVRADQRPIPAREDTLGVR